MRKSERTIAQKIVNGFLNHRYLTVVPDCNFTGYESDLLAVTKQKRLIDFEIKQSVQDFKNERKKDKWRRLIPKTVKWGENIELEYEKKDFPDGIYMHYFVMPNEIFKPELLELMPSQKSGFLTVDDKTVYIKKYAEKNFYSQILSETDLIHISRLVGIRFWNTLGILDGLDWQGKDLHKKIEELESRRKEKPVKYKYKKYVCPTCGLGLGRCNYRQLYCDVCGQRLKWSE